MSRNKRRLQKAYMKGYKDGLQDNSSAVIQEDIKYIYGGLAICMKKRRYKNTSILNLINDIQQFWEDQYRRMEEDPNCENVPSMCERLTGIDIMQVFKLEEKEENNDV